MNLKQRDRKHLGRSDSDDWEIAGSDGACIRDRRGRRYIDFTSGWCVGNLGWGHDEVLRAVDRFSGPAYVAPAWRYAPWTELAELLASIAPGKLTKCFRATGGSEAVELALQAAMLHTGRGRFLSLEGSYHGNTLGALSVGASAYRKSLPHLPRGGEKVKPPLDEAALARIERRLRRRDIAACILEPIAINLGVLVPAPDAMAELQRLCRRHGTLLIMDEVACGFGRTGRVFASEHFAVEPDMLCLAKALTGGYGAMGALVTTPAVGRSLEEGGKFYSTFGWHPLSVAAAIAAVRFLKRNQRSLLAHVAKLSTFFAERLAGIDLPSLQALRVQGLAIGLEFARDGTAARLTDGCREAGLLLADSGERHVLLLPPLNLDEKTAARGLDRLTEVAGRLARRS